jgi:hypothetical protein
LIRRILKISAWFLFSLFILAVAAVYAIRTSTVQTWLVQKAATYLSAELKTKVTLRSIDIEFFRTVAIEGLYVEDLQHDTLLYAGEIRTVIDLFNPGEQRIYLSGVDLKDAIFKLQKYENTKGLNIDFIIDYFDSGEKKSASKPFDFNPGEVRLSNVTFVYRDNRYNDPSQGIDFEDMRLTGIEADLDDIRFLSDTVLVNIEHLAFTEKSGFDLEYLEALAKFSPTEMAFENLTIKTRESNIRGNIAFSFDHFRDFDEFVEKVRIRSRFENSLLSSHDLTYFAYDLNGLNHNIRFDGNIRGTISQLRGRDLNIAFASNTRFRGDISIAGLPDFNESFFDVVVKELVTDKRDVESIPQYPFSRGTNISLPENISTLGKVIFTGKFTGFLNDFVAYGNFKTDIGYISSDINLKVDQGPEKSAYSGHLAVVGFDVGTFTGNSDFLGKTTFKADVKGRGLTLQSVNAKMDGLVTSLDLNGYEYNNIDVNGELSSQKFKGVLSIIEENLQLDFKGSIDLASSIPEYDFTANINNARLAKLNLIKRDTSAVFSTTAVIHLKGKNIDDLTGDIQLGKTRYDENGKSILLDSLQLITTQGELMNTARLRSQIMDIDIAGRYRHSSMLREAEQLVREFIPFVEPPVKTESGQLRINYNVTIKNLNPLFSIFLPQLQISPGTRLNGTANNTDRTFDINLSSDYVQYEDLVFRQILLNTSTEGRSITFENKVSKIEISDTLHIFNTVINGKTDKFRSLVMVSAASRDSANTRINLAAEATYLSTGKTLVKILPSSIVFNAQEWTVDELNTTLIDSTTIDLNNLNFNSSNQRVSFNGIISDNKADLLNVDLRNFNTELLNPFLAIYDFSMFGTATGSAEFRSARSFPEINSDMYIRNLGIYGDTLGDASIDFDFDTRTKIISALATVDKGGTKSIDINGKYYILPVKDSVDFNVGFQKTNLSAFANYARDLISDVRGKATGNLRLRGPVNRLSLTGKLMLQQTSFVVDYLNTRYSLSDEVEFTNRSIRVKNLVLNDENGNQAKVDGQADHDFLKNFRLQFNITASNFQILNTTAVHNELFYGKAYGSGSIRISGPLDLIYIGMGLKTEKNTQIYIPLSNPEEVIQTSYIQFVKSTPKKDIKPIDEVRFSGINMDFELDVTPDAEVQLIFDSKIGDIIKGRGAGNIQLEINTEGDFKMYGTYEVYSGDYLFTLQNLVNKKFVIVPGGIISWSGSPYDAEINLESVYSLRASLYDLTRDSSYTKRIPVEVHLKLTESLFNPTIDFKIVVPDIDPTAEAQVNRFISTEQEINTQTMSLLVLNRFSPANDFANQSGSSSSGVGANAAELLSHQLSNWASQISDVVNIGVNYRAADAFSQEEIEVGISTQILNDRVILDGNVGVTDNTRNTSGLVGDFTAEVKASKDGRLRFKFFNKTITNSILNNYDSPYTQGIGILYKQEFNTASELFQKLKNKFRRKEDSGGT